MAGISPHPSIRAQYCYLQAGVGESSGARESFLLAPSSLIEGMRNGIRPVDAACQPPPGGVARNQSRSSAKHFTGPWPAGRACVDHRNHESLEFPAWVLETTDLQIGNRV